jgi:DNA-directed RNA polymerase specialized sigma24 family protein
VARGLEEQCRRDLLETACHRVRQRVARSTWTAFVATAIEDRSPAEVASSIGAPVNRVYVLERRVLQMLRDEVRRLED